MASHNFKTDEIKLAHTDLKNLDINQFYVIRQEMRATLQTIIDKKPTRHDGYEDKFIFVFGNSISADKISKNVYKNIELKLFF